MNSSAIKLCPRCKVETRFMIEAELMGSTKRILRYYKCPVCGAKYINERVTISRVNGGVRVVFEELGIPLEIVEGALKAVNNGNNG